MTNEYTPPKIWSPKPNGGKFASINSHKSGSRFEKKLERGKHPLQLHSMGTPNGVKVTILLEELLEAGIMDEEYDAYFVDIQAGDQFGSGFVELNPNSKIPALLDFSIEPPVRVFESGSILLYLAEKFQMFLPAHGQSKRAEVLNWLFWQVGSAPFLGGGFGHFYAYAPEKIEYAIDRFAMEAKRQLDVLNKQLADYPFVSGDQYTIADIAIFPWYGCLVLGELYGAKDFLSVHEYKQVIRWAEMIKRRPAVQRGVRVNRAWGPEDQQMKERHSSQDFGQNSNGHQSK